METKQEKFKLEELLEGFPADVGARIILNAIKTAEKDYGSYTSNDIKRARQAVGSLSSDILLQALDQFKGTDEERTAIMYIAKHEAAREGRMDTNVMQKGAEMLENLASASKDCRAIDWIYAGELYSSANVYRKFDLHKKSAECYEKAECWGNAAEQWKNAREFERASLNYEKNEDIDNAALTAMEYDADRAINLALRSDDKTLAPKIAAQKGRYGEALKYCGDNIQLKAEIAELAREYADAITLFEQAGEYVKALHIAKVNYKDSDIEERLSNMVIRKKISEGDFHSAREYAMDHPKEEKVMIYLAEIELARGDIFMAGYYFRESGNIEKSRLLIEPILKESIFKGDLETARKAADALKDRESAEKFSYLAHITKEQ